MGVKEKIHALPEIFLSDSLARYIFVIDFSQVPTEEPTDPSRVPPPPPILMYSSKLVGSEPSRPSRGQCTGLLAQILHCETSSLMRPNKAGAL